MRKLLKFIAILALLAGLYIGGVLLWGTIFDYSPPQIEKLSQQGNATALPDSTFKCMIWNIGFGGLGEETDFWYDGGETVFQTPEIQAKNLNGITDFIAQQKNIDFVLLQEVDSAAWRSGDKNQIEAVATHLSGFEYSFSKNYNVDFVPMPLTRPSGPVTSGLASYSRFPMQNPTRHAYDSQFSWPTRIFFLDRCFQSFEVDLYNGKKLIMVNTHNSAYDKTGKLVAAELKKLNTFIESEYNKGNYVVVGGDWNQCPPSYIPKSAPEAYNEYILSYDQIPEGWKWVADPSTHTNRKLDMKYDAAHSYTSVIDHYLVSPNVKVESIKTINLDFQFSDHQPVVLEFRVF